MSATKGIELEKSFKKGVAGCDCYSLFDFLPLVIEKEHVKNFCLVSCGIKTFTTITTKKKGFL